MMKQGAKRTRVLDERVVECLVIETRNGGNRSVTHSE